MTLPRHYITGIVLFMFIIVGSVSMISMMQSADPSVVDDVKFSQFNNTFNKLSDVNDSISALQTSIVNADTDPGIFGVLNALISSVWQSFKLMFSSFGFMTGIFNGMTTIFGIPAWIPALLLLLVIILLVFSIMSAILQKEI